MCEWLSREEWCDVQLLCSGRAFSAHRAVLASVSTFLRRTLLSCPIEESQTYIVLPDFDVDAMSSVLYYVYNGEVIVAKQKLVMFLEIVKALQIFVDQTFLETISGTINDSDKYFNYEDLHIIKENAFILSSNKRKHQQYVTLKKGKQFVEMPSQYSVVRSDISSNQVRCQNWIEHVPYLENVQSSHEDRQRDSSLRDSFIETYPRNGKANGRTVGVPVISNERYREPTSALLTNANGKHLKPVDAFPVALPKTLEISNVKSLQQNAHGIFNDARLDDTLTNISKKVENSEFNMKLFLETSVPEKPSITGISGCDLKSPLTMFPLGLTECSLARNHMTSLDLRVGNIINDTVHHQIWSNGNCSKTSANSFKDFHTDSCKKNQISLSNNLTKVAILNKAMESPWCSRIPLNYKPFRRKEHTTIRASKENAAKLRKIQENDNNNNLEDTKTTEIKLDSDNDKVIKNATKEILNNSYSIDSLIAKDNFECTVCNQMFTSNESLSTHMRRHTSARYSCAECGKTFSQLRNYKYHMSVHRGTREFAATCTVCGKYFNDRGYLSSHMKIHRNRKEYKCSMCPKSFNQRVAYNMHVRIHTGVKPHVCGECGKAFSRKMLLKQHQRTHSGERPYACAHCGKRFADRSNMTLHLRLHTGIKPFSCTLCPKSFTKKHHLKSHLNFHTGAKPYSCPRCKLGFTQSSNMRTHLKKCNAPDPASTVVGIDPNKA